MRKIKKKLALVLALCLTLAAIVPMAAFTAADDITGHWAEETMRQWAAGGLFAGDGSGIYRPDASITRAEFFTLINRWKGYTAESAAVAQYTDVSPDKWYYKEVAAALAAGYTSGSGANTISPESPVTREQAMTVVGRLSGLAAGADTSVLAKASDGDAVSSWARDMVAAVVNEGMVAGSGGKLNPLSNITRAETVVLLDRVRDGARTYAFAGTYGPASGTKAVGSVTVAAPGVTLQNMSVTGDLTVAEAVGAGEATLNNIDIEGRLRVLGGGLDSVYLNNCTIRELIVEKDSVRVVLDGGSSITLARLDGTDDVIELQGNTTVGTLTVTGDGTTVRAGAGVSVTTLNAQAGGTVLETQAGTKIETANISGGTTVTGAGTITTANISSPGVSIETRPGVTNVGSGISSNIGGQTVTGGPAAPSTNGNGSGNGSGNDGGGDDGGSTAPVYAGHNVADKTVAFGTVFGDLGLPATVTLTAGTGVTGTANVIWSGTAYDAYTSGAKTVTGTLSGATVTWAPATITVTVTVSEALTVNPVAVADVTVRSTETEESAKRKLPAALVLTLSDGSTVQVSAIWTVTGAYSNARNAENLFTAAVSGLPAAVHMTQTVTAKVTVAASDVSAAAGAALTANPGSVQLPAGGDTVNVTLTAVVRDQFGDEMTGPLDLVFDVEKDTAGEYPAGVSYALESLVPTIKITGAAAVGTVTAYLYVKDTDPWVGAETDIYITGEPVAASSIAFVDSVSSMLLPAAGAVETYRFSAVVKDQNGAVMNEAVRWSLKEAVTGVAIDPASGEVTVSANASAGVSFTVAAASGTLTAEKTVAVIKAPSAAAGIAVSGDDTVSIPLSSTPNTKTYTAEVKDQYGAVMGGAGVIWGIRGTAAGVRIGESSGVLSVDSSASEGTVTVTATVSGTAVTGTKEVTLTAAAAPPAATDAPDPEISLSVEDGVLYATLTNASAYDEDHAWFLFGINVKGEDAADTGMGCTTLRTGTYESLVEDSFKVRVDGGFLPIYFAEAFENGETLSVVAQVIYYDNFETWNEQSRSDWAAAATDIAYSETDALDITSAERKEDGSIVITSETLLTQGKQYALKAYMSSGAPGMLFYPAGADNTVTIPANRVQSLETGGKTVTSVLVNTATATAGTPVSLVVTAPQEAPIPVTGGSGATDAPFTFSVENGVLYATVDPAALESDSDTFVFGFVKKGDTADAYDGSFIMTARFADYEEVTEDSTKIDVAGVTNMVQLANYFEDGDTLQVAAYITDDVDGTIDAKGDVWYSDDIAYTETAALTIASAAISGDILTVTLDAGQLRAGTDYAIRGTSSTYEGLAARWLAVADVSANTLTYTKSEYNPADADYFDYIGYVQAGTGSVSESGGVISISATALQNKVTVTDGSGGGVAGAVSNVGFEMASTVIYGNVGNAWEEKSVQAPMLVFTMPSDAGREAGFALFRQRAGANHTSRSSGYADGGETVKSHVMMTAFGGPDEGPGIYTYKVGMSQENAPADFVEGTTDTAVLEVVKSGTAIEVTGGTYVNGSEEDGYIRYAVVLQGDFEAGRLYNVFHNQRGTDWSAYGVCTVAGELTLLNFEIPSGGFPITNAFDVTVTAFDDITTDGLGSGIDAKLTYSVSKKTEITLTDKN